MKTLKILTILLVGIALSSFINKNNTTVNNDTYYYFSYATDANLNIIISDVNSVSCEKYDAVSSKYGISNQWHSYYKSEISNINGYSWDTYTSRSEKDAVEYRRKMLSWEHKTIRKMHYFKYYCD